METERKWWKEAVVYQVYPRSFRDSDGDGVGDLNGITEKLDYLKELGIDVIWLSPVYASPNDDNGYDISDYRAIQPQFGTMADFDRLLAEAHRRGIRVVMDLVANHTSDEHAWFIESRASLGNPKRDWYIWRNGRDGGAPNNWGSSFSGSAWEYDEATGQYYLHLFSKKQPDLNWDNSEVRAAIYDMMRWWCDKGVDGFRMDVISLISKPDGLPDAPTRPDGYGDPCICANGPRVHEFLREMNREVLSKYVLLTVGECAGVTVEEAARYASADGLELNMVFQFEHVDLDAGPEGKWCDQRISLPALKACLSRWQTELEGRAWNSLFFCNHDQPRVVSRLGSADPALRERSAKCIAVMLHGMRGTPYVYQGEELGMTNYPFAAPEDFDDIESINAWRALSPGCADKAGLLRRIAWKSRDNARTPMQWDASPNAGFTAGTPWLPVNPNYREINAAEQLGRRDSVFRFYQSLIALRRRSELLVYGRYELLLPDDPDLFVYRRYLDGRELLAVCNLSEHERSFRPGERYRRVLIQNLPGHDVTDGVLAPWEAYIIETDKEETP